MEKIHRCEPHNAWTNQPGNEQEKAKHQHRKHQNPLGHANCLHNFGCNICLKTFENFSEQNGAKLKLKF